MAELPVHDREVDPVFQPAAAAGDTFKNDGATELLIINNGIVDVVVTASAQRECSHGFLDDWQKTVSAGELQRFGPFAADRFNDSTGAVSVSYADETDLQVSAQRQK